MLVFFCRKSLRIFVLFVYLHREIIIHVPNIRIFPQTTKQNEQKRENNHSTRTAGQVGRGLRMHPGHGCKCSELQPRLRPCQEDSPRRPHPVRWPADRVVNITHAVEGWNFSMNEQPTTSYHRGLSQNLVPSTAFLCQIHFNAVIHIRDLVFHKHFSPYSRETERGFYKTLIPPIYEN